LHDAQMSAIVRRLEIEWAGLPSSRAPLIGAGDP
jgi:hypothetical protein